MYFTDRGIEELDDRRGDEQVSIGWLAGRLRDFVDDHPDAESTIDSLASWLARFDDDDDLGASGPVRAVGGLASGAAHPAPDQSAGEVDR